MMVKNVCLLCKKYIAGKEKVLQGEDFLTSLTLKRAGLFESSLFLYSYPIIHFPRRTNLISVILYTIVQKPIQIRLKVKKC